jgi:hypothetical protein
MLEKKIPMVGLQGRGAVSRRVLQVKLIQMSSSNSFFDTVYVRDRQGANVVDVGDGVACFRKLSATNLNSERILVLRGS